MFPGMDTSEHSIDRDRLEAWLAGAGRYVVTIATAALVVGAVVVAVLAR